MTSIVNCSLRPDRSRDAFKEFVKDGPAHESWELFQKHIVVEFAFKVGRVPGIFLLIEAESEDQVRGHIDKMPIVRDGWLDYQIDPISPVAKFE